MKTVVELSGKRVEIELTPEQIETIENTKFGDFRDIRTFEDACEATGTTWAEPNDLPTDVVAYMKLRIIALALNGGSWMTYQDTDEGKYYPWFNASGSGAGFSSHDCDYGVSYSVVGSRLTFSNSQIAKYAGEQFIDIYNQFIN